MLFCKKRTFQIGCFHFLNFFIARFDFATNFFFLVWTLILSKLHLVRQFNSLRLLPFFFQFSLLGLVIFLSAYFHMTTSLPQSWSSPIKNTLQEFFLTQMEENVTTGNKTAMVVLRIISLVT